jgi:23S rRNA (cytidine2498-2'-O)-methyltransferase
MLGSREMRALAHGQWLWACRQGFEADLIEEIGRAPGKIEAWVAAPALVASLRRPEAPTGAKGAGSVSGSIGLPIELAFARQGLPIDRLVEGELAAAVAQAIAPKIGKHPFSFHVWVADSDAGNLLAGEAARIEEAVIAALGPDAAARREEAHDARHHEDPFAQACLLSANRAAVGVIPVGFAPSFAPGGRRRIGAPAGAPSRAAAKLLEAFDWLGRAPEPGETCIDLGAAPGGWTFVLLGRRARVIAVDPAKMAPSLAQHRNLRHVQASAFQWRPDVQADWLFCDMAWRPLEVAALLAKLGRQSAGRFLVANIKLPMKKKVEFIRRVREILATGGWRDVRVRQLYHDREEVTLGAWRLG